MILRPLGRVVCTQSFKRRIMDTKSSAFATDEDSRGDIRDGVNKTIKPFRDIPGPESSKFLLLSSDQKLKLFEFVDDCYRTYGPIVKINIPEMGEKIWIQDPEDCKVLLANDGKYPTESLLDHSVYYRSVVKKSLFSDTCGLLGSHGEEWHRVRSKVQQDMLRPKSPMFYIEKVEKISSDLVSLLEQRMNREQEVEDVLRYIHRWALESMTSIFLDTQLGCLQEPVAEDVNTLIQVIEIWVRKIATKFDRGIPLWEYLSTPRYQRFDKAQTDLYHLLKPHIDLATEKYKFHSTPSGREKSILEKLILKCGPNSEIPLLMAMDSIPVGFSSTGSNVTFFLYDIATNPEKQDKLFREVIEVVGKNGNITEEKVKKMHYMKACQRESLRIHPVTLGLARRTQVDMVLSGYQIPTDTDVTYWNMCSMKNKDNFYQPTEFIPERWLKGCPEQQHFHPFAYLPFSHGPRMCVGRRFAQLNSLIVVTKMLQKYRLEYHGEMVGTNLMGTVRPDKPVSLKLVERN